MSFRSARELGIVRYWNANYVYVLPVEGAHLIHAHHTDVPYEQAAVTEGSAVTYQVRSNQWIQQEEAYEVRLFADEEERPVLAYYVTHVDDTIRSLAQSIIPLLPDIVRREIQAHVRAEEAQRQQEEAAQQKFGELKVLYDVPGFNDTSSASPLYLILERIDAHELLDETEIAWLEAHRLYGPLAHYQQNLYRDSQRQHKDGWYLVRASRYWRQAGRPEHSIKVTSYLLDRFGHTVEDLTAAILTTRGGAFRDLGDLRSAELCGQEALEYNRKNYYSYNLLGAIYFGRGDPVTGEDFFKKAIELGSNGHVQDSQLKKTLRHAGIEEQRIAAHYLIEKDSRRYAWVAQYLHTDT